MTLTSELIERMGLTGQLTEKDDISFNAALDWLRANTDFGGLETEDDVTALPAAVRLFIAKYVGMVNGGGLSGSSVTSESIGGMSKSYASSAEMENAFRFLAQQLFGKHYMAGRVRSVPLAAGWRSWA